LAGVDMMDVFFTDDALHTILDARWKKREARTFSTGSSTYFFRWCILTNANESVLFLVTFVFWQKSDLVAAQLWYDCIIYIYLFTHTYKEADDNCSMTVSRALTHTFVHFVLLVLTCKLANSQGIGRFRSLTSINPYVQRMCGVRFHKDHWVTTQQKSWLFMMCILGVHWIFTGIAWVSPSVRTKHVLPTLMVSTTEEPWGGIEHNYPWT
jgi:hypothetical protein